jgi:RNA polymerase sigma-70 factor, ECF subfamily
MATTVSDEELVRRASAGDADALGELLLRDAPRVLSFVTKQMPPLLRRTAEPQDVLQETYFDASRDFHQFTPDGEGSLFRWLCRIAMNRMVGLLRAQQRLKRGGGRRRLAEDEESVTQLLEQLAVYRRTPSASAAAHEVVRAIEDAIRRLPEQHREVIQLRHIEGLSVEETAARMHKAHDAIYWLTKRAMASLRHELEPLDL